MEKKHRTTLEKNKRFLEKNIEVTNINRSLEEKIKKLTDDLNKLVSPVYCPFLCHSNGFVFVSFIIIIIIIMYI